MGRANAVLPVRPAEQARLRPWSGRRGGPDPGPGRFARSAAADVALSVGVWVLVALSVVGALVNLASSSPWERFGWAPYAATLAVLSLVVALGPG